MSMRDWPEIGDGLWWRNQRGGKLRGVCEDVREPHEGEWIGVRLENGNFRWAASDQCEWRDLPNANHDISAERR